MRELALAEREIRGQVRAQERDRLDGLQNLCIDGLLVLLASSINASRLNQSLKKPRKKRANLLSLVGEALLCSLGCSGSLEVGVVELGIDIHFGDINLLRGGNHVSLVDTAKRNTVDLEGPLNLRTNHCLRKPTCDKEESRGQLLQENNTL